MRCSCAGVRYHAVDVARHPCCTATACRALKALIGTLALHGLTIWVRSGHAAQACTQKTLSRVTNAFLHFASHVNQLVCCRADASTVSIT